MSSKKKTLKEIFEDDDLGLLDSKPVQSQQKTGEQRLIEKFEEINDFLQKHDREPESGSISEIKLAGRLKGFRENDTNREVLLEYDRFNLLKAEKKVESVEDIFNDDFGLLDTADSLDIFNLKNVPAAQDRAEADFVAQRRPLNKADFTPYEAQFKKVHKELREGRRYIKPFRNSDKNLIRGGYYILDGVMLFLEEANIKLQEMELATGNRVRQDGRTRIIFENGTFSNMLFRSLGKQLLKNGKIVTHPTGSEINELNKNANLVNEEDLETGWIYILKTKSDDPQLAQLKDLYKIGYSKLPVQERIKNASKEPTYLNAKVHIVATYKCYNLNPQKFENLIHRFFSEVCLNIDIHDKDGRRITPREWFVVPLPIIEKVINLILNGEIVNFRYDSTSKILRQK